MASRQRHQVNGVWLSVSSSRATTAIHRPVVLVPGTGLVAADWDHIACDLGRDRDVHIVELRGHGDSDRPGRYSVDLMAADLAELLPILGTSLDVIGHSLGGLVAVRALAGSRSARALVLEDVGVPHPRTPATPERPAGELGFDWTMIEQIRPEIDAPADHWPATFTRLDIPTLVIGGGPSSFVPQQQIDEAVSLLPQGQGTTIDAGHEIHALRPDAFLQAVRTFLDNS